MRCFNFYIWNGLLLLSCQQNRNTPVNSTEQQKLLIADSADRSFTLKDEIDKDSIIKAYKLNTNIFYKQRKHRHKKGDQILFDKRVFTFTQELRLVNYDTLIPRVIVDQNVELAPGIILIKEKPKRTLKGHRRNEHENYADRLIFFDSTYTIYNTFFIDQNNPFNFSPQQITCEKCFDDGEKDADISDDSSLVHLKRITHHYRTRPVQFGFNDSGYVVINYTVSARNKNDFGIYNISSFIVLNPSGKIIHRLNNILPNISHADVSFCGQFLILFGRWNVSSDPEAFLKPGTHIYDLNANKIILSFQNRFNIPIFETVGNYYILSHHDNTSHLTDYHKTQMFFNFTKREYFVLEITNVQWCYITSDWYQILYHSKLLSLYPHTRTSF